MTKSNGGPAFPVDGTWRDDNGMRLRDYFAAKAMQGFAADPETTGIPSEVARYAYLWADAMLEEREK